MLFHVMVSGFEHTLDSVCVGTLHVDLDLRFLVVQAYVACPTNRVTCRSSPHGRGSV